MPDPKWEDVEEWARAHIEWARDALESSGPDFITYEYRGQIKAVRALLAHFTSKNPNTDPKKTVQPLAIPLSGGPNY